MSSQDRNNPEIPKGLLEFKITVNQEQGTFPVCPHGTCLQAALLICGFFLNTALLFCGKATTAEVLVVCAQIAVVGYAAFATLTNPKVIGHDGLPTAMTPYLLFYVAVLVQAACAVVVK